MTTLLYHDVVEYGAFSSSGFIGRAADLYKLERLEFERHLDLIAEAGGARLTFDDGGASALSIIAPLLESRGWIGYFFIPTNFVGAPGFLSGDAIRELHARGHVIGSHSCSHPSCISRCGDAELRYEWRESVEKLSCLLKTKVTMASVPGGFFTTRVARAAAEAGIETLFNSEPVIREDSAGPCKVIGRFSVHKGVVAANAGALARGDFAPCLRQYLSWNSKKIVKRMCGAYWIDLRNLLLSGR